MHGQFGIMNQVVRREAPSVWANDLVDAIQRSVIAGFLIFDAGFIRKAVIAGFLIKATRLIPSAGTRIRHREVLNGFVHRVVGRTRKPRITWHTVEDLRAEHVLAEVAFVPVIVNSSIKMSRALPVTRHHLITATPVGIEPRPVANLAGVEYEPTIGYAVTPLA